jgi:subtilisin family serine protease
VVGVAPGTRVIGVKVLGCDNSGNRSAVIEGIDWVTAHAAKPAIANMSFAGPASRALDDAVRRSRNSGIFYSVAAGNVGRNACNYSPARVGAGTNNGIVTAAAINNRGAEPSWSNFGRCVDIWAPGTRILSTRKGGGTTTDSGTSMASPHVGGTAALSLSSRTGAAPAAVESALKRTSVRTGKRSDGGGRIRRVYAGRY